MHKLSPGKKAEKAAAKKRQRQGWSEQRWQKHRQQTRDYHRKNKGNQNAQRSARSHRRKPKPSTQPELFLAGLAIVARGYLQNDATVWQGLGAARERRIEKAADAILRRHERKECRKIAAAQSPELAPQKQNWTPERPTLREMLVDSALRCARR